MPETPPPLELMAEHALQHEFITNKDVLLSSDPAMRVVPKNTIVHVVQFILFAGLYFPLEGLQVECGVRFEPEGTFDPPGSPHDCWYMPIAFLVDDCEVYGPR